MRLALICPIPDLELFAVRSRIHLVLPEYLTDKVYFNFYKHRREIGDYLILDNGAHEHDGPLPMSDLVMWANELRANEIVLPDVQRDTKATVRATRAALDWLDVSRPAFEEAGSPVMMIVPQGKTMQEWTSCRWAMLKAVHEFMGGRKYPVIGIAKHHEDLIIGGVRRLVADTCSWHSRASIHMLGWPRDLNSIAFTELDYPMIRSIDTARPLVFAKEQMSPASEHLPDPNSRKYPSRDSEFFTDAIPGQDRGLAYRNIAWFAQRAGDTDMINA